MDLDLARLDPRLDVDAEESKVLALQRVALARLVLHRPKWVVSDEALDPADDAASDIIQSIFAKELADTAVISISSSSRRNGFYSRTIGLVMRAAGEALPAREEGSH